MSNDNNLPTTEYETDLLEWLKTRVTKQFQYMLSDQLPNAVLDYRETEIPVMEAELSTLECVLRPTANDLLLKAKLHNVIHNCFLKGSKQIQNEDIYNGIITAPSFYAKLRNPAWVMWMITPDIDELAKINHQTHLAVHEMTQFLTMDVTNSKGDLDPKLVQIKFKAVEKIYERAFPVKNININKNIKDDSNDDDKAADKKLLGMSEEELDKIIEYKGDTENKDE